jgi:D-serine dehydratase
MLMSLGVSHKLINNRIVIQHMADTVINVGILRKSEKLIGFCEGTFLTKSADSKFRIVFTDLDDERLPRVIGSIEIQEDKIKSAVSNASMISSSIVMFQLEDGTATMLEFSDFEVMTTTHVVFGDNEIVVDDGDVQVTTF